MNKKRIRFRFVFLGGDNIYISPPSARFAANAHKVLDFDFFADSFWCDLRLKSGICWETYLPDDVIIKFLKSRRLESCVRDYRQAPVVEL